MTATLQQISEAMAAVVEAAGKSVVSVPARRGKPASGVVFSDALIVTSSHALIREDQLTVNDGEGDVPAALLGRDSGSDLALLKAEDLEAPAAALGDSSKLMLGSLVLAMGRPGTLQVSLGTVSALAASSRGWRGAGLDGLIQTDAELYQGFSGGPLLDAEGKVVGINSWFYGHGTTRALPVEAAARVVKSLQEHGRVKHPYLGIGTQPVFLAEAMRSQLGQDSGLMIITVEEGAPAAQAGLSQGDIVVGLGEAKVARQRELHRALSSVDVGSTQTVKVIRGGQLKDLQLTVGEKA